MNFSFNAALLSCFAHEPVIRLWSSCPRVAFICFSPSESPQLFGHNPKPRPKPDLLAIHTSQPWSFHMKHDERLLAAERSDGVNMLTRQHKSHRFRIQHTWNRVVSSALALTLLFLWSVPCVRFGLALIRAGSSKLLSLLCWQCEGTLIPLSRMIKICHSPLHRGAHCFGD